MNQIIPKDAFKLTKGDLKVYTYKGDSGTSDIRIGTFNLSAMRPRPANVPRSGNEVDCFTCPNCSSSPYHHQKVLGDKFVIRTGLLKGTDNWGKPALEIFDAMRPSWLPQTGEASVKGPPE